MSTNDRNFHSHNHSLFERLEDRILFDAVPDGPLPVEENPTEQLNDDLVDQVAINPATDLTSQSDQVERSEVIFVDKSVAGYEELVAELLQTSDAEVFYLNKNEDGLNQILAQLEDMESVDAIHIISHGDAGQLTLGTAKLNVNTMAGQYAEALTRLGETLTDSGDILIYGCDFSSGENGLAASNLFSELTGADVAASINTTGHESFDGDWILESHIGSIETQSLEAASWYGELATAGDLMVNITSGPNLAVDHNGGEGPSAAHLTVEITNTGDNALTDVWLFMGDYVDGTIVNDNIGVYESNAGYSLTHEGGAEDAARYLGTIAPGETVVQYWLVSYPTDTAVFGAKSDVSDDLSLNYDVWVKADDAGTALEAVETGEVFLRASTSAAANKIWPNTDSKVPNEYLDAFESQIGWRPDSSTTPNGVALLEGVWYDLGVVRDGFDGDGDFVPDHDVWMQPVGDADNYDASSLRLVHTYGVLIVKLNDGTEQVIAFEDQLYFKDIPENNIGVVGLVFYEFAGLQPGDSRLSPYQVAASGSDNVKFSGDYGAASGISITPNAPIIDFDKSADTLAAGDEKAAIGETFEYTLTAVNNGSASVGNLSWGLPVVIADEIPDGVDYAGGAATNNTLPAGKSVTVLYSTDGGATWSETEPGDLTTVTNIQWWLNASLDPGEVFEVTFNATVETNPVDVFISNTGTIGLGPGELERDEEVTFITGSQTISGTVFSDNGGTTGIVSDGILNGDEAGLGGIQVSLYLDLNSDGLIDAGDLLWGTIDSALDGSYLFDQLPDADYIVQILRDDPDRVLGTVLTSDETNAVAISGANVTAIDFGFGPILDVDKELSGSGPIYEGDLVTYRIDIRNLLQSSGGGGGTATQEGWVSAASSANWTTPANATGSPDSTSTSSTLSPSTSTQTLVATTPTGITENGTLQDVELMVQLGVTGTTGNDTVSFEVTLDGGVTWTNVQTYTTAQLSTLVGTNGSITVSLAGLLPAWDDLTVDAANTQARITHTKVGGWDQATINVDAIGFRTTAETSGQFGIDSTVTTIPLFDDYDESRLKFVSATINPDAIDEINGILTWNDIGDINAGATQTILVTFEALEPTGNTTQNGILNTASVVGAVLANGESVNNDSDTVSVTLEATATIGDTIWSDRNANGLFDSGEPGIPGVTVQLLDNSSNVIATTVTDANGNYQFKGVRDGNYTVRVVTGTLPAGFSLTADPDGGTANQSALTITSAADNTTQDFGYQIGNVFFGKVWQDFDNDGGVPETGETGIGGVTIELLDSMGVVVTSTTTDSNGNYRFANIADGSYSVRVNAGTLPANATWTQSADPDATLDHQTSMVITVAGGDISGSHDFGYSPSGTGNLGDKLFYDWNSDGIQDTTDEGIPDITVSLYVDSNGNGTFENGSDAFVASTITTADGTYSFTNLAPGDYIVVVDQSDPQFPLNVTNVNPNPTLTSLGIGQTNNNIDFPYTPYGSGQVTGNVWYDFNGDGNQFGSKETGIANIQVTLEADLNGDGDYVTIATADTDSAGNYTFDQLPDGNYRVVVANTDPDLPQDAYGNSYQPTSPTSIDLTITNGATQTAKFGFGQLATIGDIVYYDVNRNATQDWNEVGIAGVTVWLLDESDNIIDTAVTSNGSGGELIGSYRFTGIMPGTYSVAVDPSSLPPGITLANNTGDPDRDGVPSWDTTYPGLPAVDGKDENIIVTYGTKYGGADFGFEPNGTVGDYIWLDTDGDGFQDAGESGLNNVAVSITDGMTTYNTSTDSDGFYFFQGLTAGTWTITVISPVGMAPTTSSVTDLQAGVGSVGSNSAIIEVDATGAVTSVNGVAINDGLKIDFGYEFSGPHSITGTIVLEEQGSTDGLSGSMTDIPIEGLTVFLYKENGGSPIYMGSTTTDANGIYSFTNLPADNYIVSISKNVPSLQNTDLTTTAALTPANIVTDNATTVLQQVAVGAAISGLDFAFVSNVAYDFGDLPDAYHTSLANNGARHSVDPTLYLGSAPDTETDGVPSVNATADGADEDGVSIVNAELWTDGAAGGSLQISVVGDGVLLGWVDWDGDGNFTGANDLIINQTVSTGTITIDVDVPAGTLNGGYNELFARFRLFADAPAIPELAFQGSATGGEVEDMLLAVGGKPTVSISDASQTEGSPLVFDITLNKANRAHDIVLDLTTTGVTATDGTDYENTNFEYSTDGVMTWIPATNGTEVTIPEDSTAIQVRIDTISDGLAETNETFQLSVDSVVSGQVLDYSDIGTGTIIDSAPTPTLSVNDVTVNEGAGTLTFTVSLSAASGFPVTVNYATAHDTADAGDYTSTMDTLTFAPGVTSQTVTVNITNDTLYEQSEQFLINLSGASNAGISNAQGIGTILDDGTGPGGSDDDRPTLTIADISVTEGTDTHTVFTLALSNPSEEPVVLSLALANGTGTVGTDTGSALEYFDGLTWQPVTGNVTIPAGATSLQVRTTLTDDLLDEPTETVQLVATHISGTLSPMGNDFNAVATITDDDPTPTLSVNDVTVNEGAGTLTFTVSLSAASEFPVTVNYATAHDTADAGDYTSTVGTLTFTPGLTTQTVTVNITNDNLYEQSEQFLINLSGASNAGISDAQGIGTILDDGTGPGGTDDDRPTLTIADINVTEGTDTHTVFTLALSNPSEEPVVLSLVLANGTGTVGTDTGSALEYFDGMTWQPVTGNVTIPAGATSLQVRTTLTDDLLDEPTETVQLVATHISGTLSPMGNDFDAVATIIDDDPTPTLSVNDVTVNEGAGTLTFTVTLSAASGLPVTVNYATAHDTADAGDYTSTMDTLTFAPGVTTQTVTVNITNDTLYEQSEQFLINLTSATNAGISDAQGIGTILDDGTGPGGTDDDRPTLTIADISVTEGTDTHTVFTLALSNPSEEPVVLSLVLANGTGTVGTDTGSALEYFDGLSWQPVTGNVTIPAGATSLQVRTTLTDDLLDEPTETVQLVATHISGTLSPTGNDFNATATIIDDDPTPTLSVNDVTVNEGAGTLTFTVSLSAASGFPVTVNYATAHDTADAGDYTSTMGTLTFAPGVTSQTVTVNITNDMLYEQSEQFLINLTSATNAGISDAQGIGTILDDGTGAGGTDDDRPTLTIADINVTEGTDTHTVFTLALSNPSEEPVVLSLVLANGTGTVGTDTGSALEYFDGLSWQPVTGNVTIPAGATSLQVRTTLTDDLLDEPTETVQLVATHISGTLSPMGNDFDAIATIIDDDPTPTLSVNDVTVNEGAGTLTFTVSLSAASGLPVTVNYATAHDTADAGDYTSTMGTLTFAPGVTSQTVTVNITNDMLYEQSEQFLINLTSATNAGISDAQGIGTILDDGTGAGGTDDDRPTLTIADINVTEGTDTHTVFTLALSNPSEEPVVLSLALANGTGTVGTDTGSALEYFDGMTWQPVTGNVTIPAGATSLQVRTTLTDDLLDEPTETVQLVATHISGTLSPTGNDFNATATIIDDDETPTTANNTVSTPEDQNYIFSAMDVPFSDADGDMLGLIRIESISTPNGGTLVLNDGMGIVPVVPGQTITKLELDSGYLQFIPDADEFGPAYASFEFTVSDGTNYSDPAVMTINVTPVPDPPEAVDDMSSTDERTVVRITPLTNDWDADLDALELIQINGISIGIGDTITLPSGALLSFQADGSLSYDPNGQFNALAQGESALDSFEYTITDGLFTDTARVTVTIDGVNEPPVAGDDFARTPVDTPVVVPVLENDVDPNGDPLSVIVLNVDEGGSASVNPDGTITFTPHQGFTGTSTITYLVEDPHGGTSTAIVEIEVFLPYSWDSFHDFSKDFAPVDPGLEASAPPILSQEIFSLAPEPIFSGYARPGTEISGRIYDEAGRLVGESQAISDPGGNWMMQFQGVAKFQNYRIEFDFVRRSMDIYGYFGVNPSDNSYQAMQPLTGWEEAFSEITALRNSPDNSLMAMHHQHNNPIGFGE